MARIGVHALPFAVVLAVAAAANTSRGAPAPEFSLRGLNGRTLTLSSLRGKVVLLDFWASWCAPCVAGLPRLLALESRLRGQGFVIVSVALDNADSTNKNPEGKLRRFIAAHRVDFAVTEITPSFSREYGKVLGLKGGIVANGLVAANLPSWILIDRYGAIRAIHKSSEEEPKVLIEAEQLAREPLTGGAPHVR